MGNIIVPDPGEAVNGFTLNQVSRQEHDNFGAFGDPVTEYASATEKQFVSDAMAVDVRVNASGQLEMRCYPLSAISATTTGFTVLDPTLATTHLTFTRQASPGFFEFDVTGVVNGKAVSTQYESIKDAGTGSFTTTFVADGQERTEVSEIPTGGTNTFERTSKVFRLSAANTWTPVRETVDVLKRLNTTQTGTPTLKDFVTEHRVRTSVTTWETSSTEYEWDSSKPSFGKPIWESRSDGSWTRYAYDTVTGEVVATYKPWLNSPSSPQAALVSPCWVETISRTWDGYATNIQKRAVVPDGNLGRIVSQETITETDVTLVLRDRDATELMLASSPTNAVGFVQTNTTASETLGMEFGQFRPLTSTDTKGRKTNNIEQGESIVPADADPMVELLRALTKDGPGSTGDVWGVVKISEHWEPLDGEGNRNLASITAFSEDGKLLGRGRFIESFPTVPTTSNVSEFEWIMLEGEAYRYDSEGRLIETRDINGEVVETWGYPDASTTVHVDRDGVNTVQVAGASAGSSSATRTAATATIEGQTFQLPQVVSATARGYADFHSAVETHRQAHGVSRGKTNVYDAAGRLVRTTDEMGVQTDYTRSYDGGYIIDTEVTTGGHQKTVKRFRDGRLHSIEGDGVVAEYHHYAAESSGVGLLDVIAHTIYYGTDGGPRFVKRLETSSGRVLHEIRPNPENEESTVRTRFFYDSEGNLEATISPGMAPQRIIRNPVNDEQLGQYLDVDNTGTRTAADPYHTTSTAYVKQGSRWWRVTTDIRPGAGSSASGVEMKTITAEAVGPGPVITTVETPDGAIITTEIVVSRATGVKTETVTTKRKGLPTEAAHVMTSYYLAGHLVLRKDTVGNSTTTYGYNGFGDLVQVTESASGTTTYEYDLATGQLLSETVGTNPPTLYEYYPTNDLSCGRLFKKTLPNGAFITYDYDGFGNVLNENGTATYPISRGYDEFGMMTVLVTARDENNSGQTEWTYSPATGLLISKTDSQSAVSYSYYPSGKMKTRTGGRGIETRYEYDLAGNMTKVLYSDATPDVTITRAIDGQPTVISDAVGKTTLQYASAKRPGEMSAVVHANVAANLLKGLTVTRTADNGGRVKTVAVTGGGMPSGATTLEYVPGTSLLSNVTIGTTRASYEGLGTAVRSTVYRTVTSSGANGAEMIRGTTNFGLGGRINSAAWTSNAPLASGSYPLPTVSYTYDANNRRDTALRGTSAWGFAYNDRGEVEGAARRPVGSTATDPADPGRDFGYAYDEIGNRLASTETRFDGGDDVTLYVANDANELLGRTNPDPSRRWLLGQANEAASVSAKQSSTATGAATDVMPMKPRQGKDFATEASAPVATGPAWRKVEVSASQGGIGPGGGTVQKKLTGFVYFPPKNEVMLYDDDGNLIQDGRWVYVWDAENRLISMETTSSAVAAGVERLRLKFTYDWQGRRVRKLVQKAASA
ncbi:MAG: RHS repeat protein, partial [Verrucomicrobiaceae bacterium]|nr:RHS repeat protein [Verrucomicrobiaceae bacterium]